MGRPILDASSVAELKERLGKRREFEAAARALAAQVSGGALAADSPEAQAVAKRAQALLLTRHTALAYWQAGRALFQALQAAAKDPQAQEYRAYVAQCERHLGEDAEAAGASQPEVAPRPRSNGFLFEGQLTAESTVPERPRGLSDLLHDLLIAQAAREEARERGGEGQGDAGGQPPGDSPGPPVMELEALLELEEGANAELEAALLASAEAAGLQGPRRAPPASKRVVRDLRREALSPQRLQELGGPELQCAVCREGLAAGEEVQVMPCSGAHIFHPPCLAPWLADNNSCPICRHELPTDDVAYETRKEREAQDAEDRRGAANALSHNEMMYT